MASSSWAARPMPLNKPTSRPLAAPSAADAITDADDLGSMSPGELQDHVSTHREAGNKERGWLQLLHHAPEVGGQSGVVERRRQVLGATAVADIKANHVKARDQGSLGQMEHVGSATGGCQSVHGQYGCASISSRARGAVRQDLHVGLSVEEPRLSRPIFVLKRRRPITRHDCLQMFVAEERLEGAAPGRLPTMLL